MILTSKIEVEMLTEDMDDALQFFYREMMCDTIMAQKNQCLPEDKLLAWSNLLTFMNEVRDSFYQSLHPVPALA